MCFPFHLFIHLYVQTEVGSWSSVASAGLKDFQVSFRTSKRLRKRWYDALVCVLVLTTWLIIRSFIYSDHKGRWATEEFGEPLSRCQPQCKRQHMVSLNSSMYVYVYFLSWIVSLLKTIPKCFEIHISKFRLHLMFFSWSSLASW